MDSSLSTSPNAAGPGPANDVLHPVWPSPKFDCVLIISYVTKEDADPVPWIDQQAIVVSPDAGGAKRATAIADSLGMPFALIHKVHTLASWRSWS